MLNRLSHVWCRLSLYFNHNIYLPPTAHLLPAFLHKLSTHPSLSLLRHLHPISSSLTTCTLYTKSKFLLFMSCIKSELIFVMQPPRPIVSRHSGQHIAPGPLRYGHIDHVSISRTFIGAAANSPLSQVDTFLSGSSRRTKCTTNQDDAR